MGTIEIFFALVLVALVCELIDSSLGMMYGTILSPVLIIIGFNPVIVIPSILLSQALGGTVASVQHHRKKNAEFSLKSDDFKIALLIFMLGIAAVFVGVFVGASVSKTFLKTYIGILVLIMGTILLSGKKFSFSWRKITILGIISSFNKALSGGGFGPVVASGQIISGRNGKNAIGTTAFAEVPICLTGFILWSILNKSIPDYNLLIPLCIGSIMGGYFGPRLLARSRSNEKIIKLVGAITLALGFWMLYQTYL